MHSSEDVLNLVLELRSISNKNNFAKSLVQFYEKTGFLTPKQVFAAKKLMSTSMRGYGPSFSWEILVDGVYIDVEQDGNFTQLYKVSHAKNKYRIMKRTIRRRGINTPSWSTVIDNGFAHQRILKLLGGGYIRLLSHDEMVDIGRKTGLCCVCGRTLDDEESIKAGIGPVCAKKMAKNTN